MVSSQENEEVVIIKLGKQVHDVRRVPMYFTKKLFLLNLLWVSYTHTCTNKLHELSTYTCKHSNREPQTLHYVLKHLETKILFLTSQYS